MNKEALKRTGHWKQCAHKKISLKTVVFLDFMTKIFLIKTDTLTDRQRNWKSHKEIVYGDDLETVESLDEGFEGVFWGWVVGESWG